MSEDQEKYNSQPEEGYTTLFPVEFVKCDLAAIVKELVNCDFTSEAGNLIDNMAFSELQYIAGNKQKISACLAKTFLAYPELEKSIMYTTEEDIASPIPNGKAITPDGNEVYGKRVIKVTVEFAHISETEPERFAIKTENIKNVDTFGKFTK